MTQQRQTPESAEELAGLALDLWLEQAKTELKPDFRSLAEVLWQEYQEQAAEQARIRHEPGGGFTAAKQQPAAQNEPPQGA